MGKTLCMLAIMTCLIIGNVSAKESAGHSGQIVSTASAVLRSPIDGLIKVDKNGVEKKIDGKFLLSIILAFLVVGFLGQIIKKPLINEGLGMISVGIIWCNYFNLSTPIIIIAIIIGIGLGAISRQVFIEICKCFRGDNNCDYIIHRHD